MMEWINALVPTIALIIGSAATWYFKSKLEELRAVQEQLFDRRRTLYVDLLKPFAMIIANIDSSKTKAIDKTAKEIMSVEYRLKSMEFNLIGSDDTVRANNNLWQYLYKSESTEGALDTSNLIYLWGKLLLQIRKDLGNKKTELSEIDMFKFIFKDIDKFSK